MIASTFWFGKDEDVPTADAAHELGTDAIGVEFDVCYPEPAASSSRNRSAGTWCSLCRRQSRRKVSG
jgi:hypothetical protein